MRIKHLFLLLGIAFTGICPAQQEATIVGEVSNTEGRAIGGAKLVAVGSKTGEKRLSRSSADGSFVFPAIPADTWQITATFEASGDSSTTVTVAAGQSRTVLLELHMDSATTLVAIDTQATTIDTTSSRLGINVTSSETAELPVNGRTYAPLTLTAPGVVTGGTASFNDIRFNGQSADQNEVRLDGVDATSVISASPGFSQVPGFLFRLQASLDSIEEFRIDSALYPATEGHGSGGHVDLVSKSGSDQWHGALGEYLRNDEFDARNFFDGRDNNPMHMNQFGGSVGGALIRSRLFIFGSAEGLDQRAGFNVIEQSPSPSALANAAPLIQRLMAGVPAGSATGDPDVNTALKSGVAVDDEIAYGMRVDYVASAKDRLFARETRARGDYSAPDNTIAPRSLSSILHSDHLVARWTRIQNAGLINEFTAGFNRLIDRLAISTSTLAAQGIRVDFGSGLVMPGSLIELPVGYLGRGATFDGHHYHVGDLMTIVHGAHTIKLGGEAGVVRMPFSILGGTSYRFNDLDSFLQNRDGDVTTSGDLSGRAAAQQQFAGFVQDEWRIAPTVLINVGVRYEHYTATREEHNQAVLLDPSSLVSRQARGGFYPTSMAGFNPRIAISWAPGFGKGGTVIRVGAGSYEAPVSMIDTLAPILADANRSHAIGVNIPDTGAGTAGAKPESLPTTLDVGSFRHTARGYQYGISIQQAIPGKLVAQAAWVGSVSHHLEEWGQSNPLLGLQQAGNETTLLRANSNYSAVNFLTNGGNSSYNGLNVSASRRLVDNLTVTASYGWSHSIGDSSGAAGDAGLPQDPTCRACERGNSDFDVRHAFAANSLYDLPFGSHGRYLRSGWPARVLGGWTAGAVITMRTGLPVNVTIERPDEVYRDPSSGLWYSTSAIVPARSVLLMNIPGGGESRPTLRPNLVPGIDPYIRNSNGAGLNPAAFSIPLPGTYGDLGRNSLRGPGFSQFDAQISRRLRIGERHSLVIRAEAFNLFNRANFANPQASLPDGLIDVQPGSAFSAKTAPGFGQIVSTVGRTVGLGASRQLQFGLRYEF
jgi:outer membrane receptor protein involved in Fe transport